MEKKDAFIVQFWGVRGSHPVPGQSTLAFGGNTPCVELQVGGWTVVLDAGTGVIPLGRDLARRYAGRQLPIVLLLSHVHHDHTQGLPFFLPAYLPNCQLYIYGPQPGESSLEQALSQGMAPPVFPLRLRELSAKVQITGLSEGQMLLLPASEPPQVLESGVTDDRSSVRIRWLRSYAHPGGVLAYRIEAGETSLVYATDTEGYVQVDRRLAAFARGADLLIHDAQYTEEHYLGTAAGRGATQGWGHSTPRMACELAQAAQAERLALFHFDPTYPDEQVEAMEAAAQKRFPAAFAAREGLRIELARSKSAFRHEMVHGVHGSDG